MWCNQHFIMDRFLLVLVVGDMYLLCLPFNCYSGPSPEQYAMQHALCNLCNNLWSPMQIPFICARSAAMYWNLCHRIIIKTCKRYGHCPNCPDMAIYPYLHNLDSPGLSGLNICLVSFLRHSVVLSTVWAGDIFERFFTPTPVRVKMHQKTFQRRPERYQ